MITVDTKEEQKACSDQTAIIFVFHFRNSLFYWFRMLFVQCLTHFDRKEMNGLRANVNEIHNRISFFRNWNICKKSSAICINLKVLIFHIIFRQLTIILLFKNTNGLSHYMSCNCIYQQMQCKMIKLQTLRFFMSYCKFYFYWVVVHCKYKMCCHFVYFVVTPPPPPSKLQIYRMKYCSLKINLFKRNWKKLVYCLKITMDAQS